MHVSMYPAVETIVRIKESLGGKKKKWVGIFKAGGHGDSMVAIAFAKALNRQLEKFGLDRESTGIIVITRKTGAITDIDLFTGVKEFIDGYVLSPPLPWTYLVSTMQCLFDLFFDVRYVVGTYGNVKEISLEALFTSQQKLLPFSYFYSKFPTSNFELDKCIAWDQWTLMSNSSLVHISPDDLFISLNQIKHEKLVDTKFENEELAKDALCIHSGQGGSGNLKVCDNLIYEEIIKYVGKQGIPVIQLGSEKDKLFQGAVDGRGLRVNETARVIKMSRGLIACEGFLAYVARAVKKRALILFGPTPMSLFGFLAEVTEEKVIFPGHINVGLNVCPPCWWSVGPWDKHCKNGLSTCANFPDSSNVCVSVDRLLRSVEYD